MKKVVTQDNTDELFEIADEDIASSFPLFITNILPGSDAILITMEKQQVPTGTYTLGEDMPEEFEFVLITGDADCPTMLDMEEFTINEGEHLTCVIYNDDDADAVTGGQGVAFGFNGFEFELLTTNGSPIGNDECSSSLQAPCIEKNGNIYVIVDPLLTKPNNSIILWSLTGVQPGSPLNQVNNCILTGIVPSMNIPNTNGFALFCSNILVGSWNINYAFIETI